MTLATHEEVIEPEIVRTHTEWAEVIKDDLGRAVEGIVSAGKHLIAAKADVNHGKWLPMLEEIGISRSYAFELMKIGKRFSNVRHGEHLPGTVKVLLELSRLDPSDIEDGIREGAISPDMTIKEAKSFARSDWPVVPEPTPEELFQRLEKARAQNIADGISNPPRTREEREADGRAFVESLIGNNQQQIANKLGVGQKTVSRDEWPEVPQPEPEPERDSMTVALINDLRGPWRRGITSAAKKMTQKERQILIDAIETTLNELKEI